MPINISGHHVSITDALEAHIKDKLAKVERHFDKINSLQVILSLDNHHSETTHKGQNNNKAEAILRVPGHEIFANASADDMYQAISQMADKLDRQIRKYSKKLKNHKADSRSINLSQEVPAVDRAS